MKQAFGLLVLVALSGCELLGGGGGGGGGAGGGGGNLTFTTGFTYVRKDDRNVYVADQADFQAAGVLTQSGDVRTPSLSKDGKKIVFVRGGATELAIVPSAGGNASSVLKATGTQKNFRTPVFSPDGNTIAFAFDDGTVSSIGLVNVDGTGFRRLIGGSSLAYASPSYMPDGTEVLVMAGSPGLQYKQIERVNVTTAMPVSVTNMLGNEVVDLANRIVASPDGTKAIFDARVSSGVTRIFVIDLSTKVVTKVNDYMGEPGTNDSFPCWKSATTVAYSSDSGGNDNVYEISAAGTGRKLLLPKAIEPWFGPIR